MASCAISSGFVCLFLLAAFLPLCHADGSFSVGSIADVLGGIIIFLAVFVMFFAIGAIICMTCSECFDGFKRPDKIEEMRKEFNNKLEEMRNKSDNKLRELRNEFNNKVEGGHKETGNKLEEMRKKSESKMEEMRRKLFELELEKYTLKSELDAKMYSDMSPMRVQLAKLEGQVEVQKNILALIQKTNK